MTVPRRTPDRPSIGGIGMTAGLLLVAGLALGGCAPVAAADRPGAEPTAAPTAVAAGPQRPTSSADVCRAARSLIEQGVPARALDLIDRYRAGLPTPTPSPTRRTATAPTPSPSPSARPADCEPQRLAALAALGASAVQAAAPAPTAAESFRADWDRAVGGRIAPLAPILQTALLGILGFVLAAAAVTWLRRRRLPVRGTTSSDRLVFRDRAWRILGAVLVVLGPALAAATLGLSAVVWIPALLAAVAGVVIVSRPPLRRRSEAIGLVVHPVGALPSAARGPAGATVDASGPATGAGSSAATDPALGVRLVERISRLVAEGRAPLDREQRVPAAPDASARGGEGAVSAAARLAGSVLVPALPSDAPSSRAGGIGSRTRVDPLAPRVELWRGEDASVVVFIDPARRITAIADHLALRADLDDAGVAAAGDPHGSNVSADVVLDAEAAAVMEVLLAAGGRRPGAGWARSTILERRASVVDGVAGHALLRAAVAADPSSLRAAGALLARADRGGLGPVEIAEYIEQVRVVVDAAALADDAGLARVAGRADDSNLIAESAAPAVEPPVVEPVPRGWEPWLADLLLAATTAAIDLEALTGRPADERSEADARRLVRLAAGGVDRVGGPGGRRPTSDRPGSPSVLQMLAGVAFCELVPAERGSGSTVDGWAAGALTEATPEVALAVARSFSLGWRDDLSPDRKIEIERRIRHRLTDALRDPQVAERVPTDAILARHAGHAWFEELVTRG